jgi:hypothetical protein
LYRFTRSHTVASVTGGSFCLALWEPTWCAGPVGAHVASGARPGVWPQFDCCQRSNILGSKHLAVLDFAVPAVNIGNANRQDVRQRMNLAIAAGRFRFTRNPWACTLCGIAIKPAVATDRLTVQGVTGQPPSVKASPPRYPREFGLEDILLGLRSECRRAPRSPTARRHDFQIIAAGRARRARAGSGRFGHALRDYSPAVEPIELNAAPRQTFLRGSLGFQPVGNAVAFPKLKRNPFLAFRRQLDAWPWYP